MAKSPAEREVMRYGDAEEEPPVEAASPEPEGRAVRRYGGDEPSKNLLEFILGKKAEAKGAISEKAEAFTTDPSTVGSTPDANKPYPTMEEGKLARDVGLAYGKSWENFVNNKVARLSSKTGKKGGAIAADVFESSARKNEYTSDLAKTALDPNNSVLIDLTKKDADWVNKRIGDHFSRAAVAAGRSAISTLGFDPSKVALDVVSDPTELAGFHVPSRTSEGEVGPSIAVNVSSDELLHKNKNPATIVHESLHRGLKQLQDRNEDARKIMAQLPDEEYVVRHLMKSKMGDPEVEPPEMEKRMVRPTQRETAIKLFEGDKGKKNRDLVKQLEDIAANELVKKHAGGPR